VFIKTRQLVDSLRSPRTFPAVQYVGDSLVQWPGRSHPSFLHAFISALASDRPSDGNLARLDGAAKPHADKRCVERKKSRPLFNTF